MKQQESHAAHAIVKLFTSPKMLYLTFGIDGRGFADDVIVPLLTLLMSLLNAILRCDRTIPHAQAVVSWIELDQTTALMPRLPFTSSLSEVRA